MTFSRYKTHHYCSICGVWRPQEDGHICPDCGKPMRSKGRAGTRR